jgi:hypothetical protein
MIFWLTTEFGVVVKKKRCPDSIFYCWQILHFLGNEGPRTSDPSRFIRYIYNRVILENSTVRASAVSTLAKFGALVDELKVIIHPFFLFLHHFVFCIFNLYYLWFSFVASDICSSATVPFWHWWRGKFGIPHDLNYFPFVQCKPQ